MINNSSKERLRLAHQMLDKQLENSSFGTRAITQSRQSEPARTKNVQSEISNLEQKLLDLERKMENIDVSSENEDMQIFQKRISAAGSKNMNSKNSKKNVALESDEDSEDDQIVYAKIEAKKRSEILKLSHKPQPQQKQEQFFSQLKQARQKKQEKNKKSLRDSTKSVKSVKSNKSKDSKFSHKKMLRSNSKGSVKSNKNGAAFDSLKEFQLANARDEKKISNLESQLNHYKRLCQKLQNKIEQYKVIEIEYRKLQSNFSKSEQIRKQQKKIIDSLKGRS